jgi:Flp pilus assembly protein TadD
MNAESLFKQVLGLDPTNWTALTYLVDMYLREGLLRQAYHYLVELERLDADSPTVHYLMADYWYQGRDYRRARDYAVKVETVHASNPEFRNLLGNIYLSLGEVEKAVEEYTAATELAPVRTEFRLNLKAARRRLTTDRSLRER